MKNLNRMIAVLLTAVMVCLMPVADTTVMAEEISDTATTKSDSYQIKMNHRSNRNRRVKKKHRMG